MSNLVAASTFGILPLARIFVGSLAVTEEESMSERLKGKVALITGGTSGIGAATAQLFVNEGAKVVITGRSVEKGRALAAELGSNASYREADITQEEAIRESIEHTAQAHGQLDILFNNAGGPVGAPLDKLTQDHIEYGVRLLLASAMLGTKYAVEPMKASGGGCIINNSSIAGLRYRQGDLLYSALKAALHSLHKNGRYRAGGAQHSSEFHFPRSHCDADLLGWVRACQYPQR
jgi:NAD(P)-dependent dehydrogenase (short-subunit alcohol dehydrogenase family)